MSGRSDDCSGGHTNATDCVGISLGRARIARPFRSAHLSSVWSRWPGRWRRRRCHSPELGEDVAQRPNAVRERVAVTLDRLSQQIEKREGRFVPKVELHRDPR
jgi:hypothetical protein